MTEKGDFDQLFRMLYAELHSFARRFLSREADCEDIVCAAFEDVWRN
ncbi:MAG: RNA polymerase factor sigma-70, partial [Prevotella sp.]|nr:RNA polymerase factor sigma-70 [Prevotella sp.]